MVAMFDMQRVVNDLIRIRKSADLSQREIAKLIGVSYTTIQKIERGERSMWFDDVAAWLNACGSSLPLYLSQLLSAEDRKILERDRELYELFRRALLDKHKRKAVMALLEVLFAVG